MRTPDVARSSGHRGTELADGQVDRGDAVVERQHGVGDAGGEALEQGDVAARPTAAATAAHTAP